MEARFNRVRAAIAKRRWRARLALWSAYALVAFAFRYSPDEGSGYLYGMILLAVVTGALYPRTFISTGTGLYLATLVRMATLPDAHYPYISLEIAIVPIFAGLARFAVWALVDRRYRTLLAEPLRPGDALPSSTTEHLPLTS